jgi:hypothetical protein
MRNMGRRIACLAAGAVLTLTPVGAQVIGGPYPGGPMPGTYPGGYPPVMYPPGGEVGFPFPHKKGKKDGQNQNDEDTQKTSGVIKQKKSRELQVETADKRTFTFKLDNDTKYLNAEGKDAKADAFQVGQRVDVTSTQDEKGHYLAKTVQLAASGTKEASSHPTMARNAPPAGSQASTAASQASAPQQEAEAAAPATVVTPDTDDDDHAPVLHRGKPKPTAHDHDLEQEVAQDASAAPAQTAANYPRPGLTPPDKPFDPGPAEAGTAGAPPRIVDPRLALIEKAREVAFDTTEKLPNFICEQFTTRYVSQTTPASWTAQDVVSAKVVYEDGKESYQNISDNGKPMKDFFEGENGAWSKGEFGTILRDIYDPSTAARFHYATDAQIHGLSSAVYDYTIEQRNSHWVIQATGQKYNPASRGSVWVDKQSGKTLRIESSAVGLPKDFPLDTAETAVDYDFVAIGTKRVVLPVRSEVLMCQRGTPICTRNVIEFRNYHEFGADTNVKFGP